MVTLQTVWSYIKKYWKIGLGALIAIYVFLSRAQLKAIEAKATLAGVSATDGVLAQKQADLAAQAQQDTIQAKQQENNVANETPAQMLRI